VSSPVLTDKDLLYSATGRCRCGAGLAYPLDHALAMKIRAWVCADMLKGTAEGAVGVHDVFSGIPENTEHDFLPFAFWKVREETSVNNRGRWSTRPAGTVARTQCQSLCKKCGYRWQGEPYDATASSHRGNGPCPSCGATHEWNRETNDYGVDERFMDVVLDAPAQ
jgi:hypothetical protein